MRYKSIAIPKPVEGQKFTGVKLTVPDQSMSLQEILTRFTRNEPLPIGNQVNFHESDDDLEKISKMDLVDRQEYIEKLKTTQENFSKQEKKKAEIARKKLEDEALEKAKKELEKGASPAQSIVSP